MTDPHRILVTGSRTWARPKVVFDALDLALAEYAGSLPHGYDWHVIVVHGKCDPWHSTSSRRIPWAFALRLSGDEQAQLRGADWHASRWARLRALIWGEHVAEEQHPAQWSTEGGRYDRTAGFKRNDKMIRSHPARCLSFADVCVTPGCPHRGVHDSHGAADCQQRAARAGIPVTPFRS